MKRLIIALALLMPTYALAAPTNYEILSKGRILSAQAFDTNSASTDHSIIVDYQDTIWECEIKYNGAICEETDYLSRPAKVRKK